jgi:hypothetical protein
MGPGSFWRSHRSRLDRDVGARRGDMRPAAAVAPRRALAGNQESVVRRRAKELDLNELPGGHLHGGPKIFPQQSRSRLKKTFVNVHAGSHGCVIKK